MDEQTLKKYLEKSGDDKLESGNLVEGDNGFLVWDTNGENLIIVHMYGDGQYWLQYARDKAKELGLKSIYFGTRRSPKAFIRKYGFRLTGYILEIEV